jgi:hypothetical protein
LFAEVKIRLFQTNLQIILQAAGYTTKGILQTKSGALLEKIWAPVI